MVGNRDREERRDNEEEGNKRQLGSRFKVAETLMGGLGPGQDPRRMGILDK